MWPPRCTSSAACASENGLRYDIDLFQIGDTSTRTATCWGSTGAAEAAPSSAPFYGYYWWINNAVEGRPEVDAMGFKGPFISVLLAQRAVVVMTSMLPIEGGLQTAKGAAPSEAVRKALRPSFSFVADPAWQMGADQRCSRLHPGA